LRKESVLLFVNFSPCHAGGMELLQQLVNGASTWSKNFRQSLHLVEDFLSSRSGSALIFPISSPWNPLFLPLHGAI
jgi:hypothetical protein